MKIASILLMSTMATDLNKDSVEVVNCDIRSKIKRKYFLN